MKVTMPAARAFSVLFESAEELDAEYFENLSAGGLRVETSAKLAPFTAVSLTLRLEGGGEVTVPATVVAPLPDALALAFEGKAEALVAQLKTVAAAEAEPEEKEGSIWDRLRTLSHVEKLLLAPKADRSERAVLLQDSDPQVIFTLLRNPRIGIEEVIRIAKSSLLAFATAELIVKTSQWYANTDVKTALIHNPRLPTAMALRILPTLPESEIRNIARGSAVSQTLKQAALRILIKS